MLALDESPSSHQLWSLELKVKLYIIGKSWEMNQMFENENECVVLFSVAGQWWLDGHIQSKDTQYYSMASTKTFIHSNISYLYSLLVNLHS